MTTPAAIEPNVWGVDSARTPRRSDTVTIPRGAWIWGTHPDLPKNVGRTYNVTVSDYDAREGSVVWAGSGGYWHTTIEWCWPEDLGPGAAR